ncbi:hypothetical protein [Vibrio phage BONAISHI]|nr:hypothetical protein [Vibrio phage BONAISHI]
MTALYEYNLIRAAMRQSKYVDESIREIYASHLMEGFHSVKFKFLVRYTEGNQWKDIADGLVYSDNMLMIHNAIYQTVDVELGYKGYLPNFLVERNDMYFMDVVIDDELMFSAPLNYVLTMSFIYRDQREPLVYEMIPRPFILANRSGGTMNIPQCLELITHPETNENMH